MKKLVSGAMALAVHFHPLTPSPLHRPFFNLDAFYCHLFCGCSHHMQGCQANHLFTVFFF